MTFGITKMFRLCTHTQSQAKKHETNSSHKCILSIQPFSIIICDWAAFFRCKIDTGTGAACYTGGCENQSVGFRLAAIDIKGGRGNHQSREPREPTQTPLSGLPALNFRQPGLQVSPALDRKASSIGSSTSPSLPLAGTSTRLNPQYVFLAN